MGYILAQLNCSVEHLCVLITNRNQRAERKRDKQKSVLPFLRYHLNDNFKANAKANGRFCESFGNAPSISSDNI